MTTNLIFQLLQKFPKFFISFWFYFKCKLTVERQHNLGQMVVFIVQMFIYNFSL